MDNREIASARTVSGNLALILAGLILMVTNSYAAEVIYEDVRFISGVDGVQGHNTQFTIGSTGIYEAEMIDYVFPAEFDTLGLSITEGTTELARNISTDGGFSFTFEAHPGLHFANVFGDAGGALNIGMYGLKISKISNVPLPAALALFFSSLCILIFFTDKGREWKNSVLSRFSEPYSVNFA